MASNEHATRVMDLGASSKRIRVGEVTVHVQHWGGSGDTLLFAHPTGFLGAIWQPVIRGCRERGFAGRILTYDQRGHGLSSKPDTGYAWQHFVDDARELLRILEVEKAVGVGHSAGATVLACAQAQQPGHFRRIVMIDPILFEPVFDAVFRSGDNTMAARTRTRRLVWPSREVIFESYRGREPYQTWSEEALRTYIEHGTFERPDGEVELLCPGRIEAQVYRHSASIDGFAHLRRLDIPVLLVRGEQSGSFDEERARQALGCLRDGRLTTIAAATHYVPMERAEEVAGLVVAEAAAGTGEK